MALLLAALPLRGSVGRGWLSSVAWPCRRWPGGGVAEYIVRQGVSVGGDLDELAFAYPDMRFLRGVPGVLPLMKLHNLHTKDPSQNEIGLDGFTKM